MRPRSRRRPSAYVARLTVIATLVWGGVVAVLFADAATLTIGMAPAWRSLGNPLWLTATVATRHGTLIRELRYGARLERALEVRARSGADVLVRPQRGCPGRSSQSVCLFDQACGETRRLELGYHFALYTSALLLVHGAPVTVTVPVITLELTTVAVNCTLSVATCSELPTSCTL
jgi:hypothetical protein